MRRLLKKLFPVLSLLLWPAVCFAQGQVFGPTAAGAAGTTIWMSPANECTAGANGAGVVLPNTPTYNNGTSGVGATLTSATNVALTVDGVAVALNDRVLVFGQASGFQNGIYTQTQVGTGAVPWILTRDVNANSSANILTGDSLLCLTGTNGANRGYLLNTTPTPFTIGTTNLTFVQFTGIPVLVAGAGIGVSANTISLLNPVSLSLGGTGLSSGTSGGILGFTGSGTLASSGALGANQLLLGGGPGATPSALGSLGTATTLLHGNASGAPTFGQVSLTADVTGNLPVGNLASGANADATHFWRGDGSWAVPSVSGGAYPTGFNTIDATLQSGADMCAKISNAAAALNSLSPAASKGGTIDARGFTGIQACSTNIFASWPANPFTAKILLGNVEIRSDVSQVITPAQGAGFVILQGTHRGATQDETGNGSGAGTTIRASANFPSASGTVTFTGGGSPTITWSAAPAASNYTAGQGIILSNSGGALPAAFTAGQRYWVVNPSGSTFQLAATIGGVAINAATAGTGTQTATTSTALVALGLDGNDTFNVQVRDLGIACNLPGGSAALGSIGIMNTASQQGTIVDDLFIVGCYTGALIAQKGDDVQTWSNLYIKDDSVPSSATQWTCLQVGQINENNEKQRAIDINGLSCENHNVATAYQVSLNGTNIHLHNMYNEYDVNPTANNAFIAINNLFTGPLAGNITVEDVFCNAPPTATFQTDCVQIATVGGSNTYAVQLLNIGMSFGQANWHVINDLQTGGCVVATNTDAAVSAYFHEGASRTIISPSGQCTQQITNPVTFSNATINLTGIPTTSTGGGIFLCIDNNNHIYKKSTCP